MTEPKAEENQYKKYEDITDIVLKTAPEKVSGLEDALMVAWAQHVQANAEDQGKDLGDKLYEAAEKYVLKEVYGIEKIDSLPGNDAFKTRVKRIVKETIGIKKTSLVDALKERKKVHAEDVRGITRKMAETVAETYQGIQADALGDLGTDDFKPFRKYVIEIGKELSVELKEEKMPRLSSAIEEYERLMPLLEQYRKIKKAAKEVVEKGPKEEE